MVGKFNGSLSNTHIINFAKYAERRHAQEFPDRSKASGSVSAYMMTENDTIVDEDTQIFAVLDTGCNNTCHGDRWMKRYAEIHGTMPVPEEAEGKIPRSWRQGHGFLQTHHPDVHEVIGH